MEGWGEGWGERGRFSPLISGEARSARAWPGARHEKYLDRRQKLSPP